MKASDGTPAIAVLAEDEPAVLDAAREMLTDMGFGVITATNAGDALLALLGSTGPELLITDMHMPGEMDGLALAREAAERWPHLRIVVISGHGGFPLDQLPQNAVFLTKPYGADDLDRAILG